MTTSIESILGAGQPDRDESCGKHGPFVAKNLFGNHWTRCPDCQAEAQREQDEREEQARIERGRQAWRRRLELSGIPSRYVDSSFSGYRAQSEGQKRALTFAQSYAENMRSAVETGRSAIFVGRPGTGKSHLACAVGIAAMRSGHSVMFYTAAQLLRRVKSTWSKNAEETETQALRSLVKPDLLIVDEVGVQFGSDAEKLILFEVFNERYQEQNPTILISNLSLPELTKTLGDRVYDRMRENGGQCIVFDWESYRGRPA